MLPLAEAEKLLRQISRILYAVS